MTKPLSILDQGEFQNFSVSEHGITFKQETPQEDWLKAVQSLCGMYEGTELARQRTLMLLADALNFGEASYGESFSQAIDSTRQALGLTPKTIANAQWTYKRIEPARRRSGISLGHYSVLASLNPEEQEKYFDQIETHHLTVQSLKETVAEDHPKTKRGTNRKTSEDDDKSILQKLEECSHYFIDHSPTEKMKFQLAALHLAYRRKWQSGRRK